MKILILITVFSYCLTGCFPCNVFLSNVKSSVIKGIVAGKNEDGPCFGNIIIMQKNILDTLTNVCHCTPENEAVWDYINTGDSLYKGKGSLIVQVFRNDSIKKFKYPCCSE